MFEEEQPQQAEQKPNPVNQMLFTGDAEIVRDGKVVNDEQDREQQ